MKRERPALLTRGLALTGTVTGRMTYPQHQQIPKHKLPHGALVRAGKARCREEFAGEIPFGMVFAVTPDSYRSHRNLEPWYRITGSPDLPSYILPESALKPAKQAEKKREAYSQRRG
ncbi:hypothetical protein A2_00060 [Pseudomonas phage BIM BV-45]|nr:hypothetical protein A2_00060 [Pseudomonas phage BIM BV-45]